MSASEERLSSSSVFLGVRTPLITAPNRFRKLFFINRMNHPNLVSKSLANSIRRRALQQGRQTSGWWPKSSEKPFSRRS